MLEWTRPRWGAPQCESQVTCFVLPAQTVECAAKMRPDSDKSHYRSSISSLIQSRGAFGVVGLHSDPAGYVYHHPSTAVSRQPASPAARSRPVFTTPIQLPSPGNLSVARPTTPFTWTHSPSVTDDPLPLSKPPPCDPIEKSCRARSLPFP